MQRSPASAELPSSLATIIRLRSHLLLENTEDNMVGLADKKSMKVQITHLFWELEAW